jgi:hypothetical protein
MPTYMMCCCHFLASICATNCQVRWCYFVMPTWQHVWCGALVWLPFVKLNAAIFWSSCYAAIFYILNLQFLLFVLYDHDQKQDRKDRRPNTEKPKRLKVIWLAFLDDQNFQLRENRIKQTEQTKCPAKYAGKQTMWAKTAPKHIMDNQTKHGKKFKPISTQAGVNGLKSKKEKKSS